VAFRLTFGITQYFKNFGILYFSIICEYNRLLVIPKRLFVEQFFFLHIFDQRLFSTISKIIFAGLMVKIKFFFSILECYFFFVCVQSDPLKTASAFRGLVLELAPSNLQQMRSFAYVTGNISECWQQCCRALS